MTGTPLPTSVVDGGDADDRRCSGWLRIVQINDVYRLDSFPSLKTFIESERGEGSGTDDDDERERPDRVLVVVAGDFLAPYLLSSLDHGKGMVDCLNALGTTHCCLGNHETDVPPAELRKRIRQSRFLWLNANVPDLVDRLESLAVGGAADGDDNSGGDGSSCSQPKIEMPTHDIVTVGRNDGKQKRVGLLGLLTHEPALYRPNSFAGATVEPIIPATERFLAKEYDGDGDGDHHVDLWIPLTHQSVKHDREFARHFGPSRFPVILGGHDHEAFDETTQEGTRIVKAGQDAVNAAVTDIKWYDGDNNVASSPSITVRIVPVADNPSYPPDPEMTKRVRAHNEIVRHLEKAPLFRIDNWQCHLDDRCLRRASFVPNRRYRSSVRSTRPSERSSQNGHSVDEPNCVANDEDEDDGKRHPFSTKDNRIKPSTGTTALCTMLRMGMRCQCALINAGSVRGNRDYALSDNFTLSDLKDEIPFPTNFTSVYLPGRVLDASIRHSRADSRRRPTPIARGGYLHTCNNIVYDDNDECTVLIEGEPFRPDGTYLVAMPSQFFQGIDDHRPLMDWAEETGYEIDEEAAYPAKLVIVQLFSSLLWLKLGSFDEIDVNGDGVLTRDEVRRRVLQLYGNNGDEEQSSDDAAVSDLVVDSIFSVADLSGTGTVSPLEMMIVEYAATDFLSHVRTPRENQTMRDIAANVLGVSDASTDTRRGSGDVDRGGLRGELGQFVDRIRCHVDANEDGRIEREDVMQAIGELNRKDLLSGGAGS